MQSRWTHENGDPRMGKLLFVGLLVVTAVWVAVAAIWGLGVATAGLYGRGEARRTIEGATNRIQGQELFEQRVANIRGYDDQLTAQTKSLEEFKASGAAGTPDGTAEVFRLRAVVDGLRNQCLSVRQDYDADANKISKARFRDARLPAQIDEAVPQSDYDCTADQ